MTSYVESVKKLFRYYKQLGEKAMDQVAEPDLFKQFNEESNSIAILVNHLAGNMLSRFTDFLSTDGEKPWRDRDGEFENRPTHRAELLAHWEKGWACVFAAVDPLTENDLERVVYIRNEGHTVVEALNRQLAHYASHVGQIIFIAKMTKGSEWKSLSIPKKKSGSYKIRKSFQTRKKSGILLRGCRARKKFALSFYAARRSSHHEHSKMDFANRSDNRRLQTVLRWFNRGGT